MAGTNAAADDKLLAEAREYGQHLAEMLAASHFSAEEKEAWAFLIPEMSNEQLKKFDAVLRADMSAQSAGELEDLVVSIRAAQHKRDLSLSALNEDTHQKLDQIEKDIEAAS